MKKARVYGLFLVVGGDEGAHCVSILIYCMLYVDTKLFFFAQYIVHYNSSLPRFIFVFKKIV